MKSVSRYKIWLKAICKEFDLEEDILTSSKKSAYVTCARHTFYWLCFRDKIDLYRLSERLGKHRTSVLSSMKHSNFCNTEIQNKIWNNVKTRESKKGVSTSN